ncbi:hypothetical protein ABPG75_005894 [Micractinium tetrahymenae]
MAPDVAALAGRGGSSTGSAAELLLSLERIGNLLHSPPVSRQGCDRLNDALQELGGLARHAEPCQQEEEALKRRKVVGLAVRISELNRELQRQPDRSAFLLNHVGFCCIALSDCLAVAERLQRPLSRGDTFKLASGLEVVFGAGANALHYTLLLRGTYSGAARHDAVSACLAEAQRQLAVLTLFLPPLMDHGGQLAAAWARTAGRPDALLNWLAAVVEALSVAAEAGQVISLRCKADLCALCHELLVDQAFRAHAAALGQDEQAREALLCLLLRWVLPTLPGELAGAEPQPELLAPAPSTTSSGSSAAHRSGSGVGGGSSGVGGGSSGSAGGSSDGSGMARWEVGDRSQPCRLLGALPAVLYIAGRIGNEAQPFSRFNQRCVAASGGAAVLASAARAAAAVPPSQGDVPAGIRLAYHLAAARLLAWAAQACVGLESERAEAQQAQQAQQAGQQAGHSHRAAATALSSSGAGSRQEVISAALELCQLLPHMAAVLHLAEAEQQAAEDGMDASSRGSALCGLAAAYCAALQFASQHLAGSSFDSAAQVEGWAAGADAALQLLPLPLAHFGAWKQAGERGVANADGASRLAEQLAALLLCFGEAAAAWAASPRAQEQATPALATALWVLHQRACRVVNQLAAAGSSLLGAGWLMRLYMSGFHKVYGAAGAVAAASGEGSLPARQGMAVAHLEGLQAIIDAASAKAVRGGTGIALIGGPEDLFASLALSARDCPAAAGAAFRRLLHMVLEFMPASPDPANPGQLTRAAGLALLQDKAVCPGMPPRLAACVSPPLFGPIVQALLEGRCQVESPTLERLGAAAIHMLPVLEAAALQALSQLADPGTECSHADWARGHRKACKALRAAREAARQA